MNEGHQGTLGDRVLRRLGIERSEVGILGYGALCLAAIGWTDVSLANISETYFLKRVGVQYLPLAFLGSSVLLVGTGLLLSRFVANRDRTLMLPSIFAVLAAALMGLWGLFQLGIPGSTESLIIVSKQFKMAAMLVFWVVLGDTLNARQSKRLYAPLTAGATLGAIGGSFASGAIGQYIGLNMVLPFTAGVLLLGGLAAIPMGRQKSSNLVEGLTPNAVTKSKAAEAQQESGSSLSEMWRENRLFRLLALMVVLGSLVGPMLYYQFQYVADVATSGANAEEKLMNLYSQVRGWLNVMILIAQLTIASSLYRRIGVPRSAGFTPFLFLAGFAGLAASLSLSIGISAMVMTRLYNQSIYQPALKVLFNLFPESVRARATAFLDGPLDRLGGAVGNLLVLGTLQVATASAISYVAIPVVAAWAFTASVLWRVYPKLLLGAASERRLGSDPGEDPTTLLDRTTLRGLFDQLRGSDRARCRAAISLVADAKPEDAIATLIEAAIGADPATRPLLITAAVSLLEEHGQTGIHLSRLAGQVVDLLARNPDLPVDERADLLWAATHMSPNASEQTEVKRACTAALADPEEGIRLIANAALSSENSAEEAARDTDHLIVQALATENELAKRIAQRELVHLLLANTPGEAWQRRLELVKDLLDVPESRIMAAEALAEVASRHGPETRGVADALRPLETDKDPRIRASALRFAGHSGQTDRAPVLVEALGSNQSLVSEAAHDGLLALGPGVAKDLLIGHSFGRRSNRTAILSVLRRLEVKEESLREIYDVELKKIGTILLRLYALSQEPDASPGTAETHPVNRINPIVLQRLDERMDEGIRAALLFLAALKDNNQIAELEPALRRYKGQRQRSIVIEALESLLSPEERDQILPLLDETSLEQRARAVAAAPGMGIQGFEEALKGLLHDTDELTRTLSIATWPPGFDTQGEIERSSYNQEYPSMTSPVEIALLLKSMPLFEHLSTRHLINLAHATHEESFPAQAVLCEEGDPGNCMYMVIEGEAAVSIGERELAEIGPQGFFGEMALFEGVPRSATVTATSPVRLLRLDRDDLMSLMEELPSIAIGLCRVLSRKLRNTNERA